MLRELIMTAPYTRYSTFMRRISQILYCLAAVSTLDVMQVTADDLAENLDLQESGLSMALSDHAIHADFSFTHIAQLGSFNQAIIYQAASHSVAEIHQVGEYNNANIEQYGSNHHASIRQFGHGNDANVLQVGQSNSAAITQYREQQFSVTQIGEGETLTVTQY